MARDPSELIYLEPRAEWLAWHYELDKKRVLNVLRRLKVTIESTVMDDFFAYLEFDPSFETALFYLRPQVALDLFATGDLQKIREWLALTERVVGKSHHDQPWVEELCRWDAEQTLLPD